MSRLVAVPWSVVIDFSIPKTAVRAYRINMDEADVDRRRLMRHCRQAAKSLRARWRVTKSDELREHFDRLVRRYRRGRV